MAVAFRAASTPVDFALRTNLTQNVPTGTADNDVLLWFVSVINTTAPTISTPSGWTSAGTAVSWTYSGASAAGRTYLFYRVASSEPASYTITHASMYSMAEMVGFSGVSTSTPLDVAAAFNSGTTSGAGQNASASSITPATNNAMLVTFRHGWDGSAVSPTATWTERVDHPAGHVQTLLQTTATSTGTIAIPSGNTAGLNKPWITATVALRDAASVPPGPYAPEWESAVAAARAGTGQARIALIGDSLTEGEGVTSRNDRWVDQVIPALRSALGIAGTGVGHTPPRYATFLIGVSDSWRAPATASPTITSRTYARASGGYFQWTITGTAYTVLYSGGSGYGPLSVSTDGGAAETIAASSSGIAHRWHKTGLSPGSHTVRVTAGTGGGNVMGVIAYNGDSPTSGLTYLDHSWSGGSSDEWAAGGIHDVTGMDFDPHLWLDEQMGANDYLDNSDTPSTCATRFAARIAVAKSLPSKPLPVAVVLPNWPTGSGIDETAANGLGFTLTNYRDAHAATALANDGEVIDLRDSIGTLTLGDIASDGTHLNLAGQTKIANAILAGLLALSGVQSASVTAAVATGSSSASAPTVGAGARVVAALSTGSALAPAPTVRGAARVTAVTSTATAAAYAPSIAAGGAASIAAPTATATALALAPTVTAESGGAVVITAATATATTWALAPIVIGGVPPVFLFSPPANEQRVASGGLWARYGIEVGASVVMTGDHFATVSWPDSTVLRELTEGRTWFGGGRTYEVDTETADALIADGYEVETA